jgi:hypothetical protein
MKIEWGQLPPLTIGCIRPCRQILSSRHMTSARAKALHQEVSSLLSTYDFDTPLNGILLSANTPFVSSGRIPKKSVQQTKASNLEGRIEKKNLKLPGEVLPPAQAVQLPLTPREVLQPRSPPCHYHPAPGLVLLSLLPAPYHFRGFHARYPH